MVKEAKEARKAVAKRVRKILKKAADGSITIKELKKQVLKGNNMEHHTAIPLPITNLDERRLPLGATLRTPPTRWLLHVLARSAAMSRRMSSKRA